MLVLSRRCDEEIVLPQLGVTLKVLRIKGNQVRVGISAPDDVAILRGELAEPESEEASAQPGLDFQGEWLDLGASSMPVHSR